MSPRHQALKSRILMVLANPSIGSFPDAQARLGRELHKLECGDLNTPITSLELLLKGVERALRQLAEDLEEANDE